MVEFITGTVTKERLIQFVNDVYHADLFEYDDSKLTPEICEQLALIMGRWKDTLLNIYATDGEEDVDSMEILMDEIDTLLKPIIEED